MAPKKGRERAFQEMIKGPFMLIEKLGIPSRIIGTHRKPRFSAHLEPEKKKSRGEKSGKDFVFELIAVGSGAIEIKHFGNPARSQNSADEVTPSRERVRKQRRKSSKNSIIDVRPGRRRERAREEARKKVRTAMRGLETERGKGLARKTVARPRGEHRSRAHGSCSKADTSGDVTAHVYFGLRVADNVRTHLP